MRTMGYGQTCDLDCSQSCWLDSNDYTPVTQIFSTCVARDCKCIRYFNPKDVKVPKEEKNMYSLVANQVAEQLEIPDKYDLLVHCDTECHNDCLILKESMPFEVMKQCVRDLCHCWYQTEVPIELQTCTRECAEECAKTPLFNGFYQSNCIQDVCRCQPAVNIATTSPQTTTQQT